MQHYFYEKQQFKEKFKSEEFSIENQYEGFKYLYDLIDDLYDIRFINENTNLISKWVKHYEKLLDEIKETAEKNKENNEDNFEFKNKFEFEEKEKEKIIYFINIYRLIFLLNNTQYMDDKASKISDLKLQNKYVYTYLKKHLGNPISILEYISEELVSCRIDEMPSNNKFYDLLADDNDVLTHSSIGNILYSLVKAKVDSKISRYYLYDYQYSESEKYANKSNKELWNLKFYLKSIIDELEACRDDKIRDNDNFSEFSNTIHIYYRLVCLNLGKYYRNYSKRNRHSDVVSALDEYDELIELMKSDKFIYGSDEEKKRRYIIIIFDTLYDICSLLDLDKNDDAGRKLKRELLVCLKKENLQLEDYKIFYVDYLFPLLKWNFETDKDLDDFILRIKELIEKLFLLMNNSENKEIYEYYLNRYLLIFGLRIADYFAETQSIQGYRRSIVICEELSKFSNRTMDNIDTSDDSQSTDNKKAHYNVDAFRLKSKALRKYKKYQDRINTEEGESDDLREFLEELKLLYKNKGEKESRLEILKWYALFLSKIHFDSKTKIDYKSKDAYYPYIEQLKETVQNIVGLYYSKENKNLQLEFLIGLVLYKTGAYTKAIEIFEHISGLPESYYIRRRTIGLKTRYLEACCYIKLAEYSKAEVILAELRNPLIKSKQVDARVDVEYAYCLLKQNNFEACIKISEDVFSRLKSMDNNNNISPSQYVMAVNNYIAALIFSDKTKGNDGRMSIINDFFNQNEAQKKYSVDGIGNINFKNRKEYNLLLGYMKALDNNLVGAHYYFKKASGMANDYYQGAVYPDKKLSLIIEYSQNDNGQDDFEGKTKEDIKTKSIIEIVPEQNKNLERIKTQRFSTCLINLYLICENQLEKIQEVELVEKTEEEKDELFREAYKYFNRFERLFLNLSPEMSVSLKAAISIAEWIDKYQKVYKISKGNWNENKFKNNSSQMYRNFCNINIYDELGVKPFKDLLVSLAFRTQKSETRGKLLQRYLRLYKPILEIKNYYMIDYDQRQDEFKNLAHYTSINVLKLLLNDNYTNGDHPKMRLSNIGWLNDVYEGKTFLKICKSYYEEIQNNKIKEQKKERDENTSNLERIFEIFMSAERDNKIAEIKNNISKIDNEIDKIQSNGWSKFEPSYYPQYRRDDKDMLPVESKVYLASFCSDNDSFSMWQVYGDKERGCNLQFDDKFFDIRSKVRAGLSNYMMSNLDDKDYPIFKVTYIDEKRIPELGTCDILPEEIKYYFGELVKSWMELNDLIEEISASSINNERVSFKKYFNSFAADRISEIRFLFKSDKFKQEKESRIICANVNKDERKIDNSPEVLEPKVYINVNKEIKGLEVRLGSLLTDLSIDRLVTWLYSTGKVNKVELSKLNRHTAGDV